MQCLKSGIRLLLYDDTLTAMSCERDSGQKKRPYAIVRKVVARQEWLVNKRAVLALASCGNSKEVRHYRHVLWRFCVRGRSPGQAGFSLSMEQEAGKTRKVV